MKLTFSKIKSEELQIICRSCIISWSHELWYFCNNTLWRHPSHSNRYVIYFDFSVEKFNKTFRSILYQINCFRKRVKLCNKPSTSLLLSDITILLTIRLFENYFSKNEMQLYFRPFCHLLLNQPERENNNSEIIYLIYGSKANAVHFSYQRTC